MYVMNLVPNLVITTIIIIVWLMVNIINALIMKNVALIMLLNQITNKIIIWYINVLKTAVK